MAKEKIAWFKERKIFTRKIWDDIPSPMIRYGFQKITHEIPQGLHKNTELKMILNFKNWLNQVPQYVLAIGTKISCHFWFTIKTFTEWFSTVFPPL